MDTNNKRWRVGGYYSRYLVPRHRHPTPQRVPFELTLDATSAEMAKANAIEEIRRQHGYISSNPVVTQVRTF